MIPLINTSNKHPLTDEEKWIEPGLNVTKSPTLNSVLSESFKLPSNTKNYSIPKCLCLRDFPPGLNFKI